MRIASVIGLSDEQRTRLLKVAQSQTASVRLARRCGIVLLAADGYDNHAIAEMLDVDKCSMSIMTAGTARTVGLYPAVAQYFAS